MQRSDSAADEICPDHLQGEPGSGEAVDPGGGDREPPVLGVDITPVISANRRRLANLAKFLWVLLLIPAPPAPPLLPPLLLSALRVCPLLLGPWDPGNTTGDGASLLDPRIKVVAEERCAGKHSGEALTEMGEKSHARHGIWSEIQKVEAVGVHDVIEEIGERGQSPQEK